MGNFVDWFAAVFGDTSSTLTLGVDPFSLVAFQRLTVNCSFPKQFTFEVFLKKNRLIFYNFFLVGFQKFSMCFWGKSPIQQIR